MQSVFEYKTKEGRQLASLLWLILHCCCGVANVKCQMILSFKSLSKIPSDFKDNRMTATTCRSAGANITLLPWCRKCQMSNDSIL